MLVLTGALLAGCQGKREMATLSLWHVYGGQVDSPLNGLIDEFNDTVGKEKNIHVQVTAVSNTNTIHDEILAAINHEAGAPTAPDMFISYPKTVMALPDPKVLVDYRDYFSQEELKAYIPEFLQEGTVEDRLVVFPTAKSTEILFVNQTLFDEFARETGAAYEQLDTWEGIFALSQQYYQWTDAKTPEVPDDGKTFFTHDYLFNYLQVGVESLGESFFENEGIHISDTFSQVWQAYGNASVKGGMWLQEGYATEPLRTGDAIVSVASSASVLYYKDEVTFADNTSEPVTIVARPCPTFAKGKKLVMQRGAGFCTFKSTPEKERAAAEFLKWLTAPECNVRFVTQVGYMPVTQEAFDTYLVKAVDQLESTKYKSLYGAMLKTRREYTFYTAPQLSSYLTLEKNTEKYMRFVLDQARAEYFAGKEGVQDREEFARTLSTEAMETFLQDLQ